EPTENALHHDCDGSNERNHVANSTHAATTSAAPPNAHITTPASCWSRTARAPVPYGAYHDVVASVISTPSAVAGRDAANSARTPKPRRAGRPAPSTAHQNNVAVATNDACSSTCRPSWWTAAAYGPGTCQSATVTFASTNAAAVHAGHH